MTASIAIVADFDPKSKSHIATNDAITHSTTALKTAAKPEWIATQDLARPGDVKRLAKFGGIWIGPGSPYNSMEGALNAIHFARTNNIPLLGTCGGFQHIIIEYARNVLGFKDADHEESAPGATSHFISRLAYSLAGRTMTITLQTATTLARIYGRQKIDEEYLCNFGVNPKYVDALRSGSLKIAASDPEGEIRAVELPDHPFFIGTLFLPQHRSTSATAHPLISAFLKACAPS